MYREPGNEPVFKDKAPMRTSRKCLVVALAGALFMDVFGTALHFHESVDKFSGWIHGHLFAGLITSGLACLFFTICFFGYDAEGR